MPKLTLLLGRKTIQVYDLDQSTIEVGRDPDADVVIDNVSVSRSHAEIRREGGRWVVEDLGSSNGTFLHGERLESAQPLEPGDEIGMGKFSIVFEKVVGEETAPASGGSQAQPMASGAEGTMHIEEEEVEDLLEGSERERRAQVEWESGGERGKHYFSEKPAVLIGTGELCDIQVPRGPKRHVLVEHRGSGCKIRNLHWWWSMKVNGKKRKQALLDDGDEAEIHGLKLTFVGAIS